MAKVIQAILNLQDKMSKGLLAAARNTQGVTREMRTATREVINFKIPSFASFFLIFSFACSI